LFRNAIIPASRRSHMSQDAGTAAAVIKATEEIRDMLRGEVATARKSGDRGPWVPVIGSLLAAVVAAVGSYVGATHQAAAEIQRLQQAASLQTAQAQNASDLAAYQKLFDSVLTTDNHRSLQSGLAVIVLAELVQGERRDGLCRYLVSVNFDGRILEQDPTPSSFACRQAAGMILNPGRQETSPTAVAVAVASSAAGDSTLAPGTRRSLDAPRMRVPDAWQRAIADLGSETPQQRVEAARVLSGGLNGSAPLAERVALFAALVATTDLDVFRRLSLNGRYNTFVVLSEMRPLISAAQSDTEFKSVVRVLRTNAEAIRAAVTAGDTELAGSATRRQIDQTLARLPSA
jgi:hypothetical protein